MCAYSETLGYWGSVIQYVYMHIYNAEKCGRYELVNEAPKATRNTNLSYKLTNMLSVDKLEWLDVKYILQHDFSRCYE